MHSRFLGVPARTTPHCAATSGNNVSLSLFLSLSLPAATLIPPPRLSPFFPSSLPLSRVPRAAPHTDLLPLSVPVHLFFPLSARLIPLVSFSFPPPARASSPPRHVENPCPTYPPCLSHSFPFPFTLVISLSRSRGYRPPVRYIKPLGDIFSRRPWRKKKPNISWRQIVIGACTTGTVPLSADRSLVAEETVQRG